jgi:glycosyltransferase involved in cell wall biosynthesis
MKILVFTSLFPNNISPNHGIFVKERISAVARLDGCEVRVVAPVPYYPPIRVGKRSMYSQVRKEEVIEGIQVYHPRYFMIPKVAMAFHGGTMFLSLIPFIKRLRRSFDFDLIDAHYVYPDGFAAVLFGAILNKPVVVSARGSDINEFGFFPIIKRLLRFTIKRSIRSIAVCEALKNEIRRLGIDSTKVSVIPNGVDRKKFFPCPTKEARAALGLPGGRRIVLSVGALIPRKGHDFTIRALKLLMQKHYCFDVLLLIVGSGPERGDLELLVDSLGLQDHVRFVGEIPHHQLQLWYSGADVCCLASDKEGWPNVILESLACGTPVVATDIWGIPEIIKTDSVGLLSQRDDDAIAAALHQALNKAWSDKIILEFAEQHTWRRAAESVQSVFDEVVSRSARSREMSESGGAERYKRCI